MPDHPSTEPNQRDGELATPILALAQWLDQPVGQYVLQWEQTWLDALVSDVFGYHAAQIGLPHLDALRANRMPHKMLCIEQPLTQAQAQQYLPQRYDSCVLTQPHALPFDTASIDLLVVPHGLEFSLDPHALLREIDRVLIPQGHLIVTGFNPASLWGARQMLLRKMADPFLPVEGQFISVPRLKDWLKLLGFELGRGKFGCFTPAVRSEKWLNRWRFMDKAGERWWSILGNVYCMHAIKQVHGMRIIGPAWKDPKAKAIVRPAVTAPHHQSHRNTPDATSSIATPVAQPTTKHS